MNNGLYSFRRPTIDRSTRYRRAPLVFVATDYGSATCGQWVKSSDLIGTFTDLTSLNRISTWNDKSGSGNNFSTSGGTSDTVNGPIFLPRAWKGFPGVFFSNNRLTSGYKPATAAGARTVLAVIGQTAYPNADNCIYQYGASGTLTVYGLRTTGAGMTYRADYSSTGASSSGAASTTGIDVLVHVFDGSTTDKLYLNGSLVLTNTVSANTSATNGIALGALVGTNPSAPYGHFVMYEFAAWATNLSAGNITTLTTDLQAQYEV